MNEKQRAFEEQALAHADFLYRSGLGLTGNAADADMNPEEHAPGCPSTILDLAKLFIARWKQQ